MIAAVVRFLAGPLATGALREARRMIEQRGDRETAEKRIEADIAIEEIKAEIARRNAQRDVLLAGNLWLQCLFVIPLGVWFAAVIADSIFQFEWDIAALPPPLDEWAGWIITSLFLVEGGGKAARSIVRTMRGAR